MEKSKVVMNKKPLTLLQKLSEIRKSVTSYKKDKKGYGYKYVTGTQVLGSVKEKMDELGVLLVPVVLAPEVETREYETKDKEGKEVVAVEYMIQGNLIYKWMNVDDSEDVLEVPWFLTGVQNDSSKAFGSALTYSERYFIMKFFNIPTDKEDPDSMDTNKTYSKGSKTLNGKASQKQIDYINNLCVNTGTLPDVMWNKLGKDAESPDLTKQEASDLIERLQKAEGSK